MSDSRQLWEKTNYQTNTPIITRYMIEYDIAAANISALLHENVISQEEYDKYHALPKSIREIEIGKMIRSNPKIYSKISDGIKFAKEEFFRCNNISNDDVVRIANDSITVCTNQDLQYTSFDTLHFVKKNVYTVYLRLGNITLFLLEHGSGLIVKGLGEQNIPFHANYFLNFLKKVLMYLESEDYYKALWLCIYYIRIYLNRELPIEYYREFNSNSMYTISTPISTFEVDNIDNINLIDVGYNFAVLQNLYIILSRVCRYIDT